MSASDAETAAETDDSLFDESDAPEPLPRGLTLRALVPNAITSGALCCGLTGIRFAIAGDFRSAVLAVIV
ncbi:hypothetical protein ABTN38_20690, partial [Acinetobacter baumannii]